MILSKLTWCSFSTAAPPFAILSVAVALQWNLREPTPNRVLRKTGLSQDANNGPKALH